MSIWIAFVKKKRKRIESISPFLFKKWLITSWCYDIRPTFFHICMLFFLGHILWFHHGQEEGLPFQYGRLWGVGLPFLWYTAGLLWPWQHQSKTEKSTSVFLICIYASSESIINLTIKNSNNYCSFYQWVLGFWESKNQQYLDLYLFCLLTQILLWNACLHDVGMKKWGNA